MANVKVKFDEYIKNNNIARIIITKDAAICLPSDTLLKPIAKTYKRELSGIIEKIKYSPITLKGEDITRTDFYCGGIYDGRYMAIAEIGYLSVIDDINIPNKEQKSTILVCAKSPEDLKATAGPVLDVLDELGSKIYITDKNGVKTSAGEIVADITIGECQVQSMKMTGKSIGLEQSRSAFDVMVDTVAGYNNSESEI